MKTQLLNPLYVYRRRQLIVPDLRRRRQRAWLRVAPVVDRLARRTGRWGVPLTPNDWRLAAYRNRHRGRRCFVLGNGPSLRTADLDRLQTEITFASNKIYLAFDQTAWRPTYYTVVDLLVAENNSDRIRDLVLPKFHVHHLRGFFPDDPNVIWLREIASRRRDRAQDFS
ncbi:hypothetical protein HQ590_03405, partial [bacterium]|nr:hypothetical protein [bacterium]